ncbi:MFS transporter [Streptomyces sp. NPDC058045]|uniref:MFS transporter n=1 Tax=Streptomyces sp. NPDC058045 TaxID=3346311 RepID=UPI0036EB2C7B
MTEYPRHRWAALAVLSAASVVIGLDTTVLNVALPTLANDLHATTSDLQWFASSYLLVLAVLLLPAGLLGDLLGRKPVTLASLLIFGVGSAWSAYADSPGTLISARVLMGVGAALLLPLTYSWLIALFPDNERPKAMGILGGAGFVGMPLGPILGGWLLDHFFWGSVFLINVPFIIVTLVAGAVLLPGGGRLPWRRVDGKGIALSVVGLAAFTYGTIEAPVRGWTDPLIVATMVGGLVVLLAFTAWELRLDGEKALMDMSLWRLPAFRWGAGAMTLATVLGIVAIFTMPQYFSAVLGVDALGSGVRLMSLLGGIVVGIAAGVKLSERISFKAAVIVGLACIALGALLAVRTTVDTSYGWMAGWLALFGLGFGTLMIAGQNLALNSLDKSRAGVGGAIVQVMRQTGSVIGIAVLGSLLNAVYRDNTEVESLPGPAADAVRDSVEGGLAVARKLHSPDLALSVKEAFVDGVHVQMWIGAVLAALCILGTAIGMHARLGKSEEHSAQERTREGHRASETHHPIADSEA